MKRIFACGLLAAAALAVLISLSPDEAAAARLLHRMESHLRAGDVNAVCDLFHADLHFRIEDHTGGAVRVSEGDKARLCALTRENVNALAAVPHEMEVAFTDVAAHGSWHQPWTREVRYVERRKLVLRGADITLHTRSEDSMVLVRTLAGLRIRQIRSQAFLQQ